MQAICLAVFGSLANLPPDFPGARCHAGAGQEGLDLVYPLHQERSASVAFPDDHPRDEDARCPPS